MAFRPSPARARSAPIDRHVLYEASVQGVEYDLDFVERVYRRANRRPPVLLREDFCGTAALATAWAMRRPRNRAWGVDLDRKTLDWARAARLGRLRDVAPRVALEHRDVRAASRPRVDAVVALNFSYWVFHERPALLEYFRAARASLRPGGVLVLNAFGGTEAMGKLLETRRIPASQSVLGERVPGFTYVWEQASFNPIDHRLVCHIHFRFRDRTIRRAFTYDWRLWTLPELRDALAEAGFRSSEVYVEGWDDERNMPEDEYRLRTSFENQEGWLAYVVGRR